MNARTKLKKENGAFPQLFFGFRCALTAVIAARHAGYREVRPTCGELPFAADSAIDSSALNIELQWIVAAIAE